MKYYKQAQLNDDRTTLLDLHSQYVKKEQSEMEKAVAIEQATRKAKLAMTNIQQALQQFKNDEITLDELRAICQAQKQAYLDSMEESTISQFEIELIWNNGIKRIQNAIRK